MTDALIFHELVRVFTEALPDFPHRDFLADATIRRAYEYAQKYHMDVCQLVGKIIATAKRRYGDFLQHSFVKHVPDAPEKYEEWIAQLVNATINNSIPETTDPRLRVKASLYEVLMEHESLRAEAETLATQIEISCYNAVIRRCQHIDLVVRMWDNMTFVQLYSSRTACVISHLRPGGSVERSAIEDLVQKINNNEIQASQLGAMSESELCPRASDSERETITKRAQQKIKKRENKMYRCPRCKKPATSVTEAQMGAADEGNSVLCECECGMRFQARF